MPYAVSTSVPQDLVGSPYEVSLSRRLPLPPSVLTPYFSTAMRSSGVRLRS